MAHARPANDLADLLSRETGTRLLLPPLTVIGFNLRETKFRGMEMSVYDYRFKADDKGLWEVEYSGSFHFSWKRDSVHSLVATIYRHSDRWRCTRIKRPVEQQMGDAPLFGKDW